jgi:hypothetical protein
MPVRNSSTVRDVFEPALADSATRQRNDKEAIQWNDEEQRSHLHGTLLS